MAATDLKKYVGFGFIALFTVFLINAFVARIPLEYESPLWNVRMWWFIFGYFFQIAAVSYLGFYRKCQSTIITKIGCILYYILMLIYLINQISYKFTGNSPIYIPGVSEYLYSLVLYAPGLLLLVWGSKFWLPSKITLSLAVAFDVACDMIWARLIPMYQNMSEYTFDETDRLQSIINILSYFSTFLILTTLILSIVWLCMKKKSASVSRPRIDVI